MKKLSCLLFVLILSVCLFVGCTESTSESVETKTITFGQTEITLELFERATVSAECNNFTADITWTVADSTVAEISTRGEVIPLKIGTTTIKASADGVEATCPLNVTAAENAPVFSSDSETIQLFIGDTFTIDVGLTYKNVAFTYAAVSAVSDDENVAEIGEGYVVNAKEIGTSTITVTAKYLNQAIATKEITVNVVEDFTVESCIANNHLTLNVNPTQAAEFPESYTLLPKVMSNGTEIVSNVAYTVMDSDIVKIEGSTLTALKIGETTVKMEATSSLGTVAETIVTVSVERETIALDKEYIVDAYNAVIDIEGCPIEGDITDVFVKDAAENLQISKEGSIITLGDVNIIGDYVLTIQTENKNYSANTIFASYMIDGKSAIDNIQSVYDNEDTRSRLANGYIVVTTDIDLAGGAYNFSGWLDGATFDGRGHIISNFTTYSGLSPFVVGKAIVKNIAFVNVTKTPWVVQYPGYLAGSELNSTFENVFLSVNLSKSADFEQSLFAKKVYSESSISNVIIVANVSGEGQNVYADVTDAWEGAAATGTYVIGDLSAKEAAKSGINIISKLDEIENNFTEGLITLQGNVLYFADTIVYFDGEKNNVSFNRYTDISLPTISSGLDGKTIESVKIANSATDIQFNQNGNVLSLMLGNWAECGKEYLLSVNTSEQMSYLVKCVCVATIDENLQTVSGTLIAENNSGTINLSDCGIDGDIEMVFLEEGKILSFTSANGVLTLSCDGTVGINRVIVQTADNQYLLSVDFVTKMIQTKSDYLSIVSQPGNIANQYFVLMNDIDLEGASVDFGGWALGCVLDGRGYSVSNFTTYRGPFAAFVVNNTNSASVVKNIAFINVIQTTWVSVYPGMVVAGEVQSKFENVYYQAKLVPSASYMSEQYDLAVLAKKIRPGTDFLNVVVDLELSEGITANVFADFTNTESSDYTMENVYVLGSGISVHDGSGVKVVADYDELFTNTLGGSLSFDNGLVCFGNKIIKCIGENCEVYVNKATKYDVSEINSELAGKTVTAVSIAGGNAVNYSQTNDQITLEANNGFQANKDYIVKFETESGNYYANFVGKLFVMQTEILSGTKALSPELNTLDVSTLGITDEVVSVSVKEESSVESSIEGSVITITNVASIIGEKTLLIVTDTTTYELSVIFATDIISSLDQYKTIMAGCITNKYVVLSADIDFCGQSYLDHNAGLSTGTTFNGMGHKVMNFVTYFGLGLNVNGGCVIKNVAFVNVEKTYWTDGYSAAIASLTFNASFENVYFDIRMPKGTYNPNVFCTSNTVVGSVGGCIFNITVDGGNGGAVYSDAGAGFSSVNSYIVGNVSTFENSVVETVNGISDLSTKTLGSAFTYENGILYFFERPIAFDKVADAEYTFDANAAEAKIVLSDLSIGGNDIVEIYSEIGYAVEENNISLENYAGLRGDKQIVIVTQNGYKLISLTFATIIAKTADDLLAFFNQSANSNQYVVIANDIDATGKLYSLTGWSSGVVFDGKGHTVSNFATQALFGYDLSNSIIKNVAFVNVTQTKRTDTYTSPFAVELQNCIIDNVYFGLCIERSNFNVGILGNKQLAPAFYVTNCLFDVTFSGTGSGTVYAVSNEANTWGTMFATNSFVVGEGIVASTWGHSSIAPSATLDAASASALGGSFSYSDSKLYYNGTQIK